jgi:feruloyl esterase
MYHGWADQAINPGNSVNYLNSVARFFEKLDGGEGGNQQANDNVDAFLRLFMVPNMAHCGGGPGVNTFDALTALERWVEKGVAPDAVIASNAGASGGAAIMTPAAGTLTRPVCAYPRVARWTGPGSTKEAANFRCVNPPDREGDGAHDD